MAFDFAKCHKMEEERDNGAWRWGVCVCVSMHGDLVRNSIK